MSFVVGDIPGQTYDSPDHLRRLLRAVDGQSASATVPVLAGDLARVLHLEVEATGAEGHVPIVRTLIRRAAGGRTVRA